MEICPKQNENKTNMKITKQTCQKSEFHCNHKSIQTKTLNKHGDDTTDENKTKTRGNLKSQNAVVDVPRFKTRFEATF